MTGTLKGSLDRLSTHAEEMKNDAPHTFSTWSVGDVSAQGDVMICCIEKLPDSAKPRKNRQMADGNTMGSRHILVGGDCFDADSDEVAALIHKATGSKIDARYLGPVFRGPASLEHPEHGNQTWPDRCVNAVVFQRVLDAELREQRAAD